VSVLNRFFQSAALALLATGVMAFPSGAFAQEAVLRLSIKDHRFQPAEVHAPAGKPISIEVKNLDSTPAEFESKTLRVEKVVAGGATVTIKVRALPPGRYRFFDDYHEDTTEGYVVVD